eukprot:TRINITY_DN61295_c0_g1_i1.p1 TRINITY_DN61295_c0_g1~~TRINITY_DN61295_c0_g1_i1.p1  ORF type:complete len:517 (-),score=73.96 TRINITY_DN61295_c0_g1_i1:310-1794(-)
MAVSTNEFAADAPQPPEEQRVPRQTRRGLHRQQHESAPAAIPRCSDSRSASATLAGTVEQDSFIERQGCDCNGSRAKAGAPTMDPFVGRCGTKHRGKSGDGFGRGKSDDGGVGGRESVGVGCFGSKGKGEGNSNGRRNEPRAYFPLMSDDEFNLIEVPATAPSELLRDVFSRHGCAVVTGVLDETQCVEFASLWKDDLKSSDVREKPVGKGPFSQGYMMTDGLPHGQLAWTARLHRKVRNSFATIYDCAVEDLTTGMDLVFYSLPDTEGLATENLQWLHVDQNIKSGFEDLVAQGLLYIWDSTSECSSTTALWSGSHLEPYDRLMRDGYAEELGSAPWRAQSLKLNELHDSLGLLDEAISKVRRVPCPAGSLLLWNSKTIHQGWSGGPRLAVPISYEPRCRRDDAARLRKLFACALGLPTTHSSTEARLSWTHLAQRPAKVPFCVALGREEAWWKLMDRLWDDRAGPAKMIKRIRAIDGQAIAAVLRQDVLDVL